MSKKKIHHCKWNRVPKNAPDADIAYGVIASIKKRRGGVTPQLLVIESKRKSSPLHNCFEWDNSKAAEEYRIVQAREILRFLIVEIEPEEEYEDPQFVRAFVAPSSVEKEGNTSYVTIEEVCGDEELEAAYLRQLKRELNSIKNKIKGFKEFSEVVKAIDAVRLS